MKKLWIVFGSFEQYYADGTSFISNLYPVKVFLNHATAVSFINSLIGDKDNKIINSARTGYYSVSYREKNKGDSCTTWTYEIDTEQIEYDES